MGESALCLPLLEFLARLPPEETAQAARRRLMEWLSHPDP